MSVIKCKQGWTVFCLAFVLWTFAPLAFADDFAPPTWRDLPESYYAAWEFLQGPLPTSGILPDVEGDGGAGMPGEFLYDKFPTHIDLDGDGWVWDPADGDGGMVNPGRDASFAINAINWVDEKPKKLIRVQLTYMGVPPVVVSAAGSLYHPYHIPGADPGQTFLPPVQAGPPMMVDDNHLYADVEIWPNPDWEQIIVDVPMGTVIDEVVLDTISIPEPGTFALFGLGLVGLVGWRRRTRK